MKKYQIFDVYSSDETASGKAPSDINQIAAAAAIWLISDGALPEAVSSEL